MRQNSTHLIVRYLQLVIWADLKLYFCKVAKLNCFPDTTLAVLCPSSYMKLYVCSASCQTCYDVCVSNQNAYASIFIELRWMHESFQTEHRSCLILNNNPHLIIPDNETFLNQQYIFHNLSVVAEHVQSLPHHSH